MGTTKPKSESTAKERVVTAVCRGLRPFFQSSRPLPSSPQKIVVFKPCCLGDVVLATPTIAALRHYYPQARLDVAVGPWSRAVLENNPHLHALIDSGPVGQGRYDLGHLRRLVERLRAGGYDLAVTLDRSPVMGLLPWLAGIPHRVGLNSYQRGFAHTIRADVPVEPEHEARIYLNCLTAMGFPPAEDYRFKSAFYPTAADRNSLPALPPAPKAIIHPGGGVNPGMTMLDKRWPLNRFAALADKFLQAGLVVILTGTANDLPACREIAGQISAGTPLILAGTLSLGQLGALCEQSALFVGGDTGAMHLAVATGCKTVAIFGPTDPHRYGPFAPAHQARAVWRELALPAGGVGQGRPIHFDWATGAAVADVFDACSALLPELRNKC